MDKTQFEALFRSEFKKLCSFAIGYTHDLDIAKEMVQDSFVKLWERRETVDIAQNVRSYLSTSVRNRCLNHIRDNKKFINEFDGAENILDGMKYHQPDKVQETEVRNKIGQAIEELPEKCREIFRMNRYGNLKYQEIADKLGISVKTVETQMSKALQHMRIRLSEYITVFLLMALLALLALK